MTENMAVLDENKIATEAGLITVYNFDATTGEFKGSALEYLAIGVGLPAYSTEVAPGAETVGAVYVFTSSGWIIMEDRRGDTVYSTSDLNSVIVDYIGPVKDAFTSLAPATKYDEWINDKWVTNEGRLKDSLITEASNKRAVLRVVVDSAVPPLQDAIDLGDATESETTQLKRWKQYRVALNRLDLSTAPDIAWPESPAD